MIAAWKKFWRKGIAPQLSTAALLALAHGLARNDPALIRNQTTEPAPLECNASEPCQGACALGYAGWQGEQLWTVGQVEDYLFRVCVEATASLDLPLGECRTFLNAWDDGEIDGAELLAEVNRVLADRQALAA